MGIPKETRTVKLYDSQWRSLIYPASCSLIEESFNWLDQFPGNTSRLPHQCPLPLCLPYYGWSARRSKLPLLPQSSFLETVLAPWSCGEWSYGGAVGASTVDMVVAFLPRVQRWGVFFPLCSFPPFSTLTPVAAGFVWLTWGLVQLGWIALLYISSSMITTADVAMVNVEDLKSTLSKLRYWKCLSFFISEFHAKLGEQCVVIGLWVNMESLVNSEKILTWWVERGGSRHWPKGSQKVDEE